MLKNFMNAFIKSIYHLTNFDLVLGSKMPFLASKLGTHSLSSRNSEMNYKKVIFIVLRKSFHFYSSRRAHLLSLRILLRLVSVNQVLRRLHKLRGAAATG